MIGGQLAQGILVAQRADFQPDDRNSLSAGLGHRPGIEAASCPGVVVHAHQRCDDGVCGDGIEGWAPKSCNEVKKSSIANTFHKGKLAPRDMHMGGFADHLIGGPQPVSDAYSG